MEGVAAEAASETTRYWCRAGTRVSSLHLRVPSTTLAATLASHRLSPRPLPAAPPAPPPSCTLTTPPLLLTLRALLFRRSLSRLVLLPSARLPAIQPADGSHSGAVLACATRVVTPNMFAATSSRRHTMPGSRWPPCPPRASYTWHTSGHAAKPRRTCSASTSRARFGLKPMNCPVQLRRRAASCSASPASPSRSPAIGTLLDVQARKRSYRELPWRLPTSASSTATSYRARSWADTRPSLPAGWRAANNSATRLPFLLPTRPAPP